MDVVSYGDGAVRIWDSRLGTAIVSFNGHRSAVTSLRFSKDGAKLASGSKDADIIIWDILAEVGMYKLRGHKGQITAINFLDLGNADPTESQKSDSYQTDHLDRVDRDQGTGTEILATTSKDSLIKFWDLGSRHCIETHVAQSNGECWSMSLLPDASGCITAGNDGEVKIWMVDNNSLQKNNSAMTEKSLNGALKERGTLYRQGKDRTTGIVIDSQGKFIILYGSEKAVEIWRLRTGGEVQKALARKRKRKREKAAKDSAVNGDDIGKAELSRDEDVATADISDVIVPHVIVRTGGKVKSASWAGRKSSKSAQLVVTTTNNQIEMYDVDLKAPEKSSKEESLPDYDRTLSIELPGHRTDIRSLALSSDDHMLASASNGSLKVWNIRTESCIRTMECGFAICCAFLPGDKIIVLGTRAGSLELFDVASSTLISSHEAHSGATWSLDIHPDGTSLVTGSADKTAKFYAFEIVQDEIPGTKRTTPRFGLKHTRTLQLSDEILSLRFSPDARLLAISLLDNTVRVYFTDTLKPFLNLYGHKLPVLSLSISYDSRLIATCSADKNVRIWGLDFGDCHKAFFAHDDSIMAVAFVPNNVDGNGHHVFSASKDRTIKYWDADKFQHIQTLSGHHGEIWALAISRSGNFLVSASHDKSIRVWRQTDEQLFLEEEREKEMEDLHDAQLTSALDAEFDDPDGTNQIPNIDGSIPARSEVTAASKQTPLTLKAGEKLAEAISVAYPDHQAMLAYQAQKRQQQQQQPNLRPPDRPPIFTALGGISAPTYILRTLLSIPLPQLQDALLTLPFSLVSPLFTFLSIFLQHGQELPLVIRTMVFLLKIHWRQVRATEEMKGVLDGLRAAVRKGVETEKGMMGRNLAGLRIWGEGVREGREVGLGVEGLGDRGDREGKKKRGFVHVG